MTGRFKILKTEGVSERFQMRKLRRSLMAAMEQGGADPRLADPLARAISMYIRGRRGPAPVSTEHVFDCAQTVLVDTGMEDVSQRMRKHRRNRARQRTRVLVCDYTRPERTLYPWSKQRVVDAIESQYQLRQPVARILGGEIEQRLLAMDFKVVSTTLIGEVIRNELLAWGLVSEAAKEVRLSLEQP